MLLWITLGSVWYVACGVLAYGLSLAHFQREFPTLAPLAYADDRRFSWLFAALGPMGLLAVLVAQWSTCAGPGRYGFMYRNPHKGDVKGDAT